MKFTSFKTRSGQASWGVLVGQAGATEKSTERSAEAKIFDLSSRADSLLDFLRKANRQTEIENIAAELKSNPKLADIPLSSVELQACLPNPPSMRDGYAFRQHVEAARRNRGVEMIAEFDLFPTFYYTNHTAVIGPGPCKVQRLHLAQLDFELEGAVVVGKSGINIKAKDADDYIFGYTIMNDFSARAWQMEEMKMSLGPAKGKDFATALGPWLVTRDELSDFRKGSDQGERFDLEMLAIVNGKQVSKGNMLDMNWTFAQILERVSYGTKIFPGDVIGSGTVGTGCFMELNGSRSEKQWLKPGDRIVLKIAGLGELDNSIEEVPEDRTL